MLHKLSFSIQRVLDKIYPYFIRLQVPNAPVWQRYGLVLLLIISFFLLKATIAATIQKDIPFLFSLFIVLLSSWVGGLGPGLLATLLSGSLTYYLFLEPKFTVFGQANLSNIFLLLVFFTEGVIISLLSESRRRSEKQKSEFLGIVSHEIKNPLASIKGYAELIQKISMDKKEKKLSDFAGRIDGQVSQVITMINDLLDISKIETGRLTFHYELFKIADLVEEVVQDQQVTTDTHKIHLTCKSKKHIYGDKYRIGQVIANLSSNAIKYSPNSKNVKVTVMDKGSKVTISVADHGVGIDRDDQKKLFLPYFRASNSNVAKGTGIGLYITSEIVKKHKGRIWVNSTKGKGSTFYLELPSAGK